MLRRAAAVIAGASFGVPMCIRTHQDSVPPNSAEVETELPPWIRVCKDGALRPVFIAHDGYAELRFGGMDAQADLGNTVLLVPLLLSDECKVLIDAAEERHAGAGSGFSRLLEGLLEWKKSGVLRFRFAPRHDASNDVQGVEVFHRMRVCEMTTEARDLSSTLINDRALSFLQCRLPAVARSLFGDAIRMDRDRSERRFSFAQYEPTINRYTAGGLFPQHQDGRALSVVVTLSEAGSFDGGGTMFFPYLERRRTTQDGSEHNAEEGCAVLVNPPIGVALLFNGSFRHAGEPIASGIRHVYVASFDLS